MDVYECIAEAERDGYNAKANEVPAQAPRALSAREVVKRRLTTDQ